jgi:hypothetical protein
MMILFTTILRENIIAKIIGLGTTSLRNHPLFFPMSTTTTVKMTLHPG